MVCVNDDELWQGFNANGEPSHAVTKLQCREGALHGSAHVWVWRQGSKGAELLLQRRSEHTRTWKGYLDISAAGHIDAGESPIGAAVRETHEELHIDIQSKDLVMLFAYRLAPLKTDSGIIENEFQWVYAYESTDVTVIQPDSDEVTGLVWATIPQITDYLSSKTEPKIVPHSKLYMDMLFENIQKMAAGKFR